MLTLGVIGTNWITKQFVEAAKGRFKLTAVYSRKQATADKFIAETNPAQAFTDLEAFLASGIDVVYIASPNSLHAAQTVAALNHGLHVICEKPLVSHISQLAQIQAALDAHPEAMVFEAARHLYDPNFAVIQQYLFTHHATGASLGYMKYSSRYDAFLAGDDPNIFSPRFAGGALMDLGVYLVYAAVAWFGKPQQATYLAHKLANGIDGDGVACLAYQDLDVVLRMGKTANSQAPSELYFGRDTLRFDSPGELNHLRLNDQSIQVPHAANPMTEEAAFFAQAFEQNDRAAFELKWSLAKTVHQVMAELRQSAGLHFTD
ncbi:Gfo/Idh/MocA family protein [Lacticaseibacillus jixiensis]|uniref:Gfo/Idh/MocA family protein n=1 Tax=Lacticaseibacillus jixiensis TaxID=3231926 RepID=UPI0036F245E9